MKVDRCLIIYLSLDKPLGPMAPPLGLFLLRPTNWVLGGCKTKDKMLSIRADINILRSAN